MEVLTSEELKSRVEELLSKRFPGSRIHWEDDPDVARPGGTLVWSGFEDTDHVDRQIEVGDFLRQELGPQKKYLGMIFTLTPEEREFILQEA